MSSTSVIVFADIAGSTALYEVLGNARATEAVTHVVHWLGQSVESQGGRVVKTLGDGVLATFDTAPRAVQAMAALMRDHQQHLREWPSEMCLQVRVGVAGGEVVEVDGDCYGDAVNLAARLCERARPGEVWVSASTDSKSPVPIHATSRSVHSHSIGRAVKFSGYRYIVLLPKAKPQVCACGFCVFYSSFPASFSSRSMSPRMKSFCFRPFLAR